MNADAARFLRFAVGLLALVTLGWVLTGQAAKPASHHTPLVTDWSHRHLIFSRPATEEAFRRAAEDPRYWQQQYRRMSRTLSAADESGAGVSSLSGLLHRHQPLRRDWSEDLGSLGFGVSIGAQNFPAKFAFDLNTASCGSDFVIFPTALASSGTQASIVAFNNLYSGCGGTVPSVYWAYDTNGQILTSPTFSQDGSQVAFVQETNDGTGTLIVLKWAASGSESVTGPLSLTPVISNADYLTCSAPCMAAVTLQNGSGEFTDDTTSSVFYDYAHDVAWVGGTDGYLHQITGVFKGTPTEVLTDGFPVQVNLANGAAALSSPVYDATSGNVFVGDLAGYFYRVSASGATVTASGRLDYGTGFVDGPIIDSAAQVVYVFSSSDGTRNCPANAACAAVDQLPTTFASGAFGTESEVGDSTISPALSSPMYSGSFDSSYETSMGATGNLYVCGNTVGPPIVYQIPVVGGAMQFPNEFLPAVSDSSSTSSCSPVTDIVNPNIPASAGGPTEWVFVSAQTQGVADACGSSGCVFNLKVTQWLPNNAYVVGQEVLDINGNIQVVSNPGTSGPTTPNWGANTGDITYDPDNLGTHWLNQGPLSPATLPSWQPNAPYTKGTEILDSNNDVELVTHNGTSGSTEPTWPTSAGLGVGDGSNGLTWRDAGANATSALPAAGGTSGIIMDNVVSSTTLAGASQVYFSTLSNETCATSGGAGGCAVQASQPALQ